MVSWAHQSLPSNRHLDRFGRFRSALYFDGGGIITEMSDRQNVLSGFRRITLLLRVRCILPRFDRVTFFLEPQ